MVATATVTSATTSTTTATATTTHTAGLQLLRHHGARQRNRRLQLGLKITQGLGALDHRTFGGRLAEDAPIDPQVLQTHPIGDFRDWDVIRDYARQIGVALSAMTFPEPGASGASAPG